MAARGQPPQQPEQTFKIFCRAVEGYCLSVRHNAVVLARTNPHDEHQHWVRHSTSIRDDEGLNRAFALVNKVTGEAIKHSLGQSQPVRLVPYNPDNLSVLWTAKNVDGNIIFNGFQCIRMVNNINLCFHVDEDRNIVLREQRRGDYNQHWKIVSW